MAQSIILNGQRAGLAARCNECGFWVGPDEAACPDCGRLRPTAAGPGESLRRHFYGEGAAKGKENFQVAAATTAGVLGFGTLFAYCWLALAGAVPHWGVLALLWVAFGIIYFGLFCLLRTALKLYAALSGGRSPQSLRAAEADARFKLIEVDNKLRRLKAGLAAPTVSAGGGLQGSLRSAAAGAENALLEQQERLKSVTTRVAFLRWQNQAAHLISSGDRLAEGEYDERIRQAEELYRLGVAVAPSVAGVGSDGRFAHAWRSTHEGLKELLSRLETRRLLAVVEEVSEGNAGADAGPDMAVEVAAGQAERLGYVIDIRREMGEMDELRADVERELARLSGGRKRAITGRQAAA